MHWDVLLKSEDGSLVGNSTGISEVLDPPHVDHFPLLRYIDPWGNTVFNSLQIDDFIVEWNGVKERALLLGQSRQWETILKMAEKSKEEPHLYLWFQGD
jgi:hypothetical protein